MKMKQALGNIAYEVHCRTEAELNGVEKVIPYDRLLPDTRASYEAIAEHLYQIGRASTISQPVTWQEKARDAGLAVPQ